MCNIKNILVYIPIIFANAGFTCYLVSFRLALVYRVYGCKSHTYFCFYKFKLYLTKRNYVSGTHWNCVYYNVVDVFKSNHHILITL